MFTSERPSAPAASTARATAATSQADGESFAKSGSAVARRHAATISAADSGASSTFGQERFSSIAATSSSSEQVSAYSSAEKPPTETQSGSSSSRSRGSVSARNAARPGLASPIELSIPDAVSAIRGGSLPGRGSGVIVFVTKASSCRAVSGAVSASRQPEAFSSITARSLCDTSSLARSVAVSKTPGASGAGAGHDAAPTPCDTSSLARCATWSTGPSTQRRFQVPSISTAQP